MSALPNVVVINGIHADIYKGMSLQLEKTESWYILRGWFVILYDWLDPSVWHGFGITPDAGWTFFIWRKIISKCKQKSEISCILHLKTFPVFLQTGNKNVRMHPENREDRLFICCNTIYRKKSNVYRKKSNVHFFLKYVRFFPVLLCMAS